MAVVLDTPGLWLPRRRIVRATKLPGAAFDDNSSDGFGALPSPYASLTSFTCLLLYMRTGAAGTDRAIVTKRAGNNSGWSIYDQATSHNLSCFRDRTSDMNYRANFAPPLNVWHAVAVVHDTAGVNGTSHPVQFFAARIGERLYALPYSLTTAGSGNPVNDGASEFRIGDAHSGTNSAGMRVALVMFCPAVALTEGEVDAWGQDPLVPPRGCQGAWLPGFDPTTDLWDLSGFGIHLSPVTGSTVVTTEGVDLALWGALAPRPRKAPAAGGGGSAIAAISMRYHLAGVR